MELLSTVKARAIWLLDINDLNPRGKDLGDLIDWIKDAYSFAKAPSSITDFEKDTNALAFLNGNFQLRDEFFINVDLRIYNDGLIADTRSSTKDSDVFLADLLTSAAKEFNLVYKPDMVHTKLYLSELNVRCGHALNKLNSQLQAFAEKLSKVAKVPTPPRFELSALGFWDGEMLLKGNANTFRFERKVNMPPSENRYYSSAPVHTDEHLDLLNDLESILGTGDQS